MSRTAVQRRSRRRVVEVLAFDSWPSSLPYVTVPLRVHGNSEVAQRAVERRRDFDHRGAEPAARRRHLSCGARGTAIQEHLWHCPGTPIEPPPR
ncbi:hypothetical protein [Streptomyces sp. 2A115]|uniref:hypothetical protein n=1 Tax=Streptomyces sp. 2A115 TaxID=3457439 RepID=UPI003FCFB2D8